MPGSPCRDVSSIPEHLRDTKVLKHLDQVRDALAHRRLGPPVSIELHPTNVCNFSCAWCGYRKLAEYHGSRDRNTEQLRGSRLGSLIDEFADMGVRAVTISGGGEPLLHKHASDMLERLLARGLRFGITTNGSPVTERLMPLILGGEYIRFSIYKITSPRLQEHIITTVGRLVQRRNRGPSRCRIGVAFLADHDDYLDNGALIRRCLEVHPDYVAVRPVEWFDDRKRDWRAALDYYEVLARGFDNHNLAELRERVHELGKDYSRRYRRCPSIYITSHVAATGDVYPCCEHTANVRFRVGNVNHQSFREIWESDRYRDMRASIDAARCPFCRYNRKNDVLTEALRGNVAPADHKSEVENPHADFL